VSKKMIVRCRKCWEDVAVVVVRAGKKTELGVCPKCGRDETYIHARVMTATKRLRDQEAEEYGSTGSG
jgi:protein-arginine kinase activator protein McsA